jgi:hypothetical protein
MLVVRFLPQSQRTSPPRQRERIPSGAAEFVLGDHTMEVWHRILKSGCRIEARQLATAERLQRCLTL